jgi:phenylalanyl-tRNA synthetase beta subunit
VEYGKISSVVQALQLEHLTDFRLIDLYQGPSLPQEKISFTVRLTFTSPARTLTQDEVNESCDRVIVALRRAFEVELR